MSRTTIDFGIDLGTTNSAIAVLRGASTDIVKNNDLNNDITPSAVYIDKRGQIQVGQRAKNRLEDQAAADDAYVEFKRRMGTDHKYEFLTAKRVMRPEELSAEVLKSLRDDVRQRTGEEIGAAVITVPAAFEQKQCAATKLAGDLAGFSQCPLIQEPVAAALAYGFQSDVGKEYWLVYDFGGGTFDAAVVKADDGSIAVVNHGGDNFLGGSDIDWAVVEQLVIPELTKTLNVSGLSRGKPEWRPALAVIKRAVEIAKIQLSRSDSAFLEDCRFKDSDGETVEAEFQLTRSMLISVAEPIIMRSVEICRRVLKEKRLSPSAIQRVVLVGGPTLAPYFREIVQQSLGIALDYTVDPLTVVARGAAVFAGTQRIEGKGVPQAAAGQFAINLEYAPIGPDENPTVQGIVKSIDGKDVTGHAIEFINRKTRWRSGKLPLKADGRFKVNVLAEKGSQNIFDIELADAKGSVQQPIPNTLAYTIGISLSEQPIINSIGVALANNEVHVYFKKGEPLPAKQTHCFKTSRALKKGESGSALSIPVVEGDQNLADRNLLLGRLDISGANVRRDVPPQTEIEVTLNIDASRIIRAKAYVPFLDEEFDAVLESNKRVADAASLQTEYDAEVKRLGELRALARSAEESATYQAVDDIAKMTELASLIDAAHADPDAAGKAERQLLQMKISLDQADNAVKWPALVAEARSALADVQQNLEGSSEQKGRIAKLKQEVEQLIEKRLTEPLQKKVEQLQSLQREIWAAQPAFWLGFFEYLIEQRHTMQNRDGADRLINQGRKFIDNNNLEGLQVVVNQLRNLLPPDAAAVADRGYKSALLR